MHAADTPKPQAPAQPVPAANEKPTAAALQHPANHATTAFTIPLTEELRTAARTLIQEGLNIDWDGLGFSSALHIRFVFESANKCAAFSRALRRCLEECPSQRAFLRPLSLSNGADSTGTNQVNTVIIPPIAAFTGADIADASALAAKLNQPADAVSNWLAGQLDEATRADLKKLRAGGIVPPELRGRLATVINRIVEGPSIYEPQRFHAVQLSAETRQLSNRKPEGGELVTLNRLLLADAFPQAIATPPVSLELRIAVLHDLALQLRPLAEVIAKTKRHAVKLDHAMLTFPELFWKAFDPEQFLITEGFAEEAGPDSAVDAECKQTAERLLTLATGYAGQVVAASKTGPCHHISITVSRTGEWSFRDGDATLELRSSVKRYLLTLAVLRKFTFHTDEFHKLYAGSEAATKQTAASTCDTARNVLSKEFDHFACDGSDPRIRHIRGLSWGTLADEKLLRERLAMLAPVTGDVVGR